VPRSVDLRPHPTTAGPDVASIVVNVDRTSDGFLRVRFELRGDCRRLVIPAPAAPRIAIGLWRHTCFEAFLALATDDAYHEYNLSPSGEWAAHAFRSYRDGGPVANEALRPTIRAETGDTALMLEARLPLMRLSPRHAREPLDVGLAAVVEASDGTRSYWAIRHPAERPDFHHREAFALHLEAPDSE
jgi:hypothetical protein